MHRAKGGGWHTAVVMSDVGGHVKLMATAVSRAREVLYIPRWNGIPQTPNVRFFSRLEDIRPTVRQQVGRTDW